MTIFLDTFGQDVKSQRLAQRNDGGADAAIVFVFRDVANEGAINLECIDGERLQHRERGVTRAEIIERHERAHILELRQHPTRVVLILHEDGFGELELECFG